MKTLLIIVIIFLSANAKAQKNDTLFVPVGKFKFIKVGERIYKLVSTLEEVSERKPIQADSSVWNRFLPNIITPGTIQNFEGIKWYNSNSLMMPAYIWNLK